MHNVTQRYEDEITCLKKKLDESVSAKDSLEKKYDELFSSYQKLLEHNKVLTAQLPKDSDRFDVQLSKKPNEEIRSKRSPMKHSNRTSRSPSAAKIACADKISKVSEFEECKESFYSRRASTAGRIEGKSGTIRKNREFSGNSINLSVEDTQIRHLVVNNSLMNAENNQITLEDLETVNY